MIMPTGKSCFCRQLAAINKLDLREWLFHPGMLFGERDIWWGNRGTRVTPHEGIDLCFYRSSSGPVETLPADTQVPVLYDGQVARIVDDFLGKTIFVRHTRYEEKDRELYSIYGHVTPRGALSPGAILRAGDIICSLATRRERTSAPPPHLHLSTALISKTLPPEKLDWNFAGSEEIIFFVDPMTLVDCAYAILTIP